MAVVYAEKAKTNTRYKVIKYDSDTKRGTLKGQYSEFETNMDKETLRKLGYEIKVYDDADDPGMQTMQSTIPPPPVEMQKKAKAGETDAWGSDE